MLLEIAGKESVTLKAGQSGSLPPRTVHDDKNASQTAPLKFLVFHVAKKGDPLAVPVKVGVVILVMLSVFDVPESLAAWRSGVEGAAAALEDKGPDEALSRVWESMPGADLEGRLAAVRATGHPDADALAKAVAEFAASGAPRRCSPSQSRSILSAVKVEPSSSCTSRAMRAFSSSRTDCRWRERARNSSRERSIS